MQHISVLLTPDSHITCTRTLRKTAWVLRYRSDVRMGSTRDIFDPLPSCRRNMQPAETRYPIRKTGAVRHSISLEAVVSPTSRTAAGARAH